MKKLVFVVVAMLALLAPMADVSADTQPPTDDCPIVWVDVGNYTFIIEVGYGIIAVVPRLPDTQKHCYGPAGF